MAGAAGRVQGTEGAVDAVAPYSRWTERAAPTKKIKPFVAGDARTFLFRYNKNHDKRRN